MSSIYWGYVYGELLPKGLPLCSAAWYLALAVWLGSGPNPHLHAFTQPWRQPNLYPRSPAIPRLPLSSLGTPSPDARTLHPQPPSSGLLLRGRLLSSNLLSRLSKPWSLRASPLRSRPYGLTALGRRSRARERSPRTRAAAAPAAVTNQRWWPPRCQLWPNQPLEPEP